MSIDSCVKEMGVEVVGLTAIVTAFKMSGKAVFFLIAEQAVVGPE